MVINFLSNKITFNALDSMLYLLEKGGSEENYNNFISCLEEGVERMEKGEMGPISESVIYGAMDHAYPYIIPFSDLMRFSLIKSIPQRLRDHLKYGEFHQKEIDNLANFCKEFHELSLERRSENIPRVEQILGISE
jgi:hypothetical protein